MFAFDAGPPQLQQLAANLLVGSKLKKLLAVIPGIAFGTVTRLHPVGSNHFISRRLPYQQVVADHIELITVEAQLVGDVQPSTQLLVEHSITKTLACAHLCKGGGKGNLINRGFYQGASGAVPER